MTICGYVCYRSAFSFSSSRTAAPMEANDVEKDEAPKEKHSEVMEAPLIDVDTFSTLMAEVAQTNAAQVNELNRLKLQELQ